MGNVTSKNRPILIGRNAKMRVFFRPSISAIIPEDRNPMIVANVPIEKVRPICQNSNSVSM